jgi:hypothetical protein
LLAAFSIAALVAAFATAAQSRAFGAGDGSSLRAAAEHPALSPARRAHALVPLATLISPLPPPRPPVARAPRDRHVACARTDAAADSPRSSRGPPRQRSRSE